MASPVIVLLAMLLNIGLLGSKRFAPPSGHTALATLIRSVERKLNRPQRSQRERRQRGMLLLAAAVMTGWAFGSGLHALFVSTWRSGEIFVLAFLLPVRPTWERADAIFKALKAHDTAAARLALQPTVWRHYALLDEHAVARAAIEILAVQLSEKIVAPVLWYMVLGLPALCVSKAIYLLIETLCQPMQRANDFTQPIRLAHHVMHYIPARVTMAGWLLGLLLLPSAHWLVSLRTLGKSPLVTASPEQVSVLAVACALNLSLGGPTSVYTDGQWFGPATAKATSADIKRAQVVWACLLGVLVAALAV